MRILYSHRVQSHDGQGVHIEELITAFRKAGHEVLVVGPRFYDTRIGGESRLVAIIRSILPGAITELAEIVYNIPASLRLRHAYWRFAPDFVYERYNLYFLAGMLLKWLYRAPYYLEVNSPLAHERAKYGGLKLQALAQRLERLVWRSADRIFVVTAVLGEIALSAGVAPERVTVIPNGADRAAYPPTMYRARRDHPVTVGFVGFVREWHGLDAVITSLATSCSDLPLRLLVVGSVQPTLVKQAQEFGVEGRVRFTGLQQRESIPDIIKTFDIALQPRAVSYASPLKIFEYMACGRAIVAPDQPNIREILSDGETAILFNPDEPNAMWQAIRRLAGDPLLREELGRAARNALEVHDYTWEGNASKVVEAVAADAARHGSG